MKKKDGKKALKLLVEMWKWQKTVEDLLPDHLTNEILGLFEKHGINPDNPLIEPKQPPMTLLDAAKLALKELEGLATYQIDSPRDSDEAMKRFQPIRDAIARAEKEQGA